MDYLLNNPVPSTSTGAGILTLPSRWEERQDVNGRTYYLNHAACTTQWQRPGVLDTINPKKADHAVSHQPQFHINHDVNAPFLASEASGTQSGSTSTANDSSLEDLTANLRYKSISNILSINENYLSS